MTRSFILCRPRDIVIARACQQHMETLGWKAHVMIDPSEWEQTPDDVVFASYGTQGRGMFGNACANGIMDGMLANSANGDVVMKIDCDVWISKDASDWFASPVKARTVKTTYWKREITWGGVWSATREHLKAARLTADTLPRCRCGEAYLNLRALLLTDPGLEMHSTQASQWREGDRGFVATLEIAKRADRIEEGLRLFDSDAL